MFKRLLRNFLRVEAFTLSRLYRMMIEGTAFCCISACREDWSSNKAENKLINKKKTKELKTKLKNRHYAFITLLGGYKEPQSDGSLKSVTEHSFLVKGIDLDSALKLGKEYNQHTILYSADKFIGYYECETGKCIKKFRNDTIATSEKAVKEYFSKIRGKGKEFVFMG